MVSKFLKVHLAVLLTTLQAPKANCNPVKLTAIATYFQKSRVAHNIKDLEKHLPSVGSISGMVVKGAEVFLICRS